MRLEVNLSGLRDISNTSKWKMVSCNGASTRVESIKYGFPQRSDLDPLQFLIYVNCLSNASLKPNFILFTEGRPINVFMSQT